jgi:hypothetical protein
MNILRAIRRQRLVNRAYGNGYEQGRFDAAMEHGELQAAAAEAIREVHQRDDTEPYACDWCGEGWPCTPIRALDEESA